MLKFMLNFISITVLTTLITLVVLWPEAPVPKALAPEASDQSTTPGAGESTGFSVAKWLCDLSQVSIAGRNSFVPSFKVGYQAPVSVDAHSALTKN